MFQGKYTFKGKNLHTISLHYDKSWLLSSMLRRVFKYINRLLYSSTVIFRNSAGSLFCLNQFLSFFLLLLFFFFVLAGRNHLFEHKNDWKIHLHE